MASGSSIVNTMDEKFCQCPICLEQFKEPKLLPCLHRFCSKCLKEIIGQAQGVLQCPECRQECDIPTKGVDGFKTDFYMNSIIDFVELQKSMQECHIKECFSCSKNRQMSAYCFKCNDFFCDECHNHHVTSKMMIDHKSHVLSLEEVESKNISLEKLMSLKDVPGCKIYPENVSQLCCTSCGNIPVCYACSFGTHKDHSVREVISLASAEKDRLTDKLDNLGKCKGKLDMMTAKVKKIQEEIVFNAKEERDNFLSKFHNKVKEIERKKRKIREQIDVQKLGIEVSSKQKHIALKQMMDKEIQEVKDKYDKLFRKKKIKTERSLKELQDKLFDKESRLDGMRVYLNQKSNYVLKSIRMKEENKMNTIKKILQHFENALKRYENLTTTATSILSAKDNWTAVNCVSDITPAVDVLIEDVNKEFKELDKLEAFEIVNSPLANLDVADCINMTEYEERVIEIDGLKSKNFNIEGFANVEGENFGVFITISEEEQKSFHCVVSMGGKILRKQFFNEMNKENHPSFTECTRFKVSVMVNNSTGIISLHTGHDDSYVEKNINDIDPNWEKDRQYIETISFDYLNKHLYLGGLDETGEIKQVYQLDYQLEPCHILQIPPAIKRVDKIKFFEGKFLVSELEQPCVHVVTLDGRIVHTFKAPVKGKWEPVDMTVDKHGFIYILMEKESAGDGKQKGADHRKGDEDKRIDDAESIIVQFSRGWSRALTIRPLDRVSYHMAVTETSQGEKLLLAIEESGQIYVFGLEEADL